MALSTEKNHMQHVSHLEYDFVKRATAEIAAQKNKSTKEKFDEYVIETTALNSAVARTLSMMNNVCLRDTQDRCNRIEDRLERVEIAAWIAAASAAMLVLAIVGLASFFGYKAGWFG